MNATLRATAAILRADLLQRVRTPRFWIVVFALGAFMWWCLPPADADYLTVSVGEHVRGRYSSAWIGLSMALIYSPLLSLAGFYLVRGTVARDLETRTWQLLVATTMSRHAYLVAKWLSHLAVFAATLLVGLGVALALQLLRAEDLHIDLVELVKPVLLITLPALALTAALAVWFDLVPWLRRSAGNVLFFVVFIVLISVGVSQANRAPGAPPPFPGDFQGLVSAEYDVTHRWPAARSALEQITRDRAGLAAKAQSAGTQRAETAHEDATPGLSVGTQPLEGTPPVLAEWSHWNVRASLLAGRAFWLALAFVLLLSATPFLDRFAARAGTASVARPRGASLRWLDSVFDRLLAPLQRGTAGTLLAAELRLTLRSRRWWWWPGMAIAGIVQLAAPDQGLVAGIIAAWLLCMDVFSRLVLREHETRTAALVFTAAGMRSTLLWTRIAMATGLACAVVLPAVLRLAVQHPSAAVATLVVAMSVALWALALGAVFRNPRPFELCLLVAGYISVQGALVLDTLAAPMTTLAWHAASIPVAVAVLLSAWRQGLAARA
ncbi:ABC transporter permease [Lysobacter yangpyeongensis]|uniref:ABC transporter permease n=1 Tax=Lysobacter yangpyeongensis TaxID=346182 RepID=A0ABW0SM66_9GAMM